MVRNILFGIAIFITIFFGSNLNAQLPPNPINLNADISFNGTDYEMVLTWQAGTSHTMTDLFNVYIASGNTENPMDFSLSTTITRDGDETAVYSYSQTFTVPDKYSVYVTGVNINGEGPGSFHHFHTGPAIISGYVTTTYDSPIANADLTIKAMSPPDTIYYYYTTTNDSGYFEIEVPDGNYKVFVGGDFCYDEWYHDAERESEATVITTKYGYRTNIIIEANSAFTKIINGYVKDKATGYPVYPANVDFLVYEGENRVNVISVQTSNDGYFSITLTSKYRYKAMAYDNNLPKKYMPMYYKNSYDFLESEYIKSQGNSPIIVNFELEEYPNSLNEINGTVRDNLGNGVKSMLILYKHQVMSGVRTIESDDNGKFSFKKLEKGKYIIRALPYGSYTSGFYNTKDYVEPHWFNATLIDVDENTEYIDHLIVVNHMDYPEGNYLIEGAVFQNQNIVEGKNEKVQDEIYISGAVTYLLNSKMQTVAIDYGDFSFPNLASDHYTLRVDKIGYEFYTSGDVYVNEIDTVKYVPIFLEKHPHANPTISFKTTPVTEAFVGQSYSYDADAVTNSIDSISYDLIESPQGMTVNGKTGLITWIPKKEGTFTVTLEAYLVNNPTVIIQQTWNIEVKEGESTAYLKVFVQNGPKKFPDAILKLYSSDFSSTFTTTTNNYGEAFYSVPALDYYLHLSGDLFEDCWYNNKTDLKDADIISLTTGDTIEIYSIVTEKIVTFKISGLVADSKSPIVNASVHFILETGEIRTVSTDALGRFNFEIGKDTAFRAFAVKDGQYTAQYYPDLNDYAEAWIQENISSPMFDFLNLEPLPKSTVTISGKILNESAIPIPGVVVAYGGNTVDDGSALKFQVDFVNSTASTDGNFNLVVPISKNYILRAYPANQNYYPAYYSDEVEPSYSWEKGKVINATDGIIDEIYIKTQKVTPTSGVGVINGKVEMVIFNLMNIPYSQMSPIGVTVFAIDRSDKICKYVYTNSGNGNFNLDNLALSEWEILAEKVGLTDENAKQTVNLNQNEPTRNDIFLYYSFGSSVDEDAEKIVSIYPNPTGSIIYLSFKEENALLSRFSVIDNLGNERISFDSNESDIKINVSQLSAGTYYLRISRGTKFYTMPFVKLED